MSQLSLALEAEISTRHLSFLETGRTQPSREMVLLLARVLELPLRSRNELLTAAGYAPVYRETGLDAPEMAQVKQALGFMLRQIPRPRRHSARRTRCACPTIRRRSGPTSSTGRRPRRPSSSGSIAIFCARATPRRAADAATDEALRRL
jgi:transcriptional regulator with XRE-family HTH domain